MPGIISERPNPATLSLGILKAGGIGFFGYSTFSFIEGGKGSPVPGTISDRPSPATLSLGIENPIGFFYFYSTGAELLSIFFYSSASGLCSTRLSPVPGIISESPNPETFSFGIVNFFGGSGYYGGGTGCSSCFITGFGSPVPGTISDNPNPATFSFGMPNGRPFF